MAAILGATTEGIETKGRENQTVNSMKTPQRSATGFFFMAYATRPTFSQALSEPGAEVM